MLDNIVTYGGIQYILRSDLTLTERLNWDEWRKGKNVSVEQIDEVELIRLGDYKRWQSTIKEAG